MPSLRQLLATHSPLLLIDATSAHVQVGWLAGLSAAHWATAQDEAGVGIFQCLQTLAVDQADAAGFIFCEGPGSVLGVRTAAMALRTWQVLRPRPVFAYRSLSVVAAAFHQPEISVIADARRDTWHVVRGESPLRRVPTGELSGALVMPEGFRNWTQLPPGVKTVPYSLAEILPTVAERELFHLAENPDAFLHEEPSYATWTPKIHRAPAPK